MSKIRYVITNREVNKDRKGLKVFGKVPSEKGPNELRLAEVRRDRTGAYRVKVLTDKLGGARVRRLSERYDLDLDSGKDWYASLLVACKVFEQCSRLGKSILIYVHGYNNDMGDVMRTCEELEALYDVIVIPFSWPANGGGAVSGKAVYLGDKADARASADALNSAVGKLSEYFRLLTEKSLERIRRVAEKRHPDNKYACQECYTRLIQETCSIRLNLLCHSMGNYLFKYALKPSGGATRGLVFDNIALVAADANNPGHREWVEEIQIRNRLYVVINENDYALGFSRIKPGREQRARLGHYLKELNAANACYVNLTDATGVENQHSYFIPSKGLIDPAVKAFFAKAFSGAVAERDMEYRTEGNYYQLG